MEVEKGLTVFQLEKIQPLHERIKVINYEMDLSLHNENLKEGVS